MSKELDKLEGCLKKAQRQIEILCHGFNVTLSPNWDTILGSILDDLDVWEKTGEMPKHTTEEEMPPWVLYMQTIKRSLGYTVIADTLPMVLFNQFKNKFLVIIQEIVVPALREYKAQRAGIDMSVFKPLLTVKINK
jgi:hypothetical protein